MHGRFSFGQNHGFRFRKLSAANWKAFSLISGKEDTSRALPKFTKIYYREFLFHWFVFQNVPNFRLNGSQVENSTVLGYFPRKFLYHLPLSRGKFWNVWLNGKCWSCTNRLIWPMIFTNLRTRRTIRKSNTLWLDCTKPNETENSC